VIQGSLSSGVCKTRYTHAAPNGVVNEDRVHLVD